MLNQPTDGNIMDRPLQPANPLTTEHHALPYEIANVQGTHVTPIRKQDTAGALILVQECQSRGQ
jgi:hypothetical protein